MDENGAGVVAEDSAMEMVVAGSVTVVEEVAMMVHRAIGLRVLSNSSLLFLPHRLLLRPMAQFEILEEERLRMKQISVLVVREIGFCSPIDEIGDRSERISATVALV